MAKRVVMVGAAKSGLDYDGLLGEPAFFNRIMAGFMVHPRQSRRHPLFHRHFSPLVRGFWKLQGHLL
jgi:hypothetical protein